MGGGGGLVQQNTSVCSNNNTAIITTTAYNLRLNLNVGGGKQKSHSIYLYCTLCYSTYRFKSLYLFNIFGEKISAICF